MDAVFSLFGLKTSGITGAMTLTKSGSTAHTMTFPDASVVVAGSASALTSGRVPFATAGGLLTDSASLTWSGATLAVSGSITASATSVIDLGSGSLPSAWSGSLLRLGNADAAASTIEAVSLGNSFSFVARVAGGTRSAPTATPNGQEMLIFAAAGHDGTAWTSGVSSARLYFGADGAWSASNTGCFAMISATPNGSTTRADVLKVQGTAVTVMATTASTSTTTGALVVGGGAGIAGAIYGGSSLTIAGALSGVTTIAASGQIFDSAATTPSLSGGNQAAFTGVSFIGRRSTGEYIFQMESADGALNVNFRRIDADNALEFRAGSTVMAHYNDTGCAIGASALLASERVRVAGGTMGTPGSTDALIANGQLYCGNTGATSIQTAGGLTAASDILASASSNGDLGVRSVNANSGTYAVATIEARANSGSNARFLMRQYGSNFTSSTAWGLSSLANLGVIQTSGASTAGIAIGIVGVSRPIYFGVNASVVGQFSAAGSFVLGSAALSTSATDGFLYLPTCAGTPTGTPTSFTGRVPLIYDSTNNKLYAYNSAWKAVTLA